MHFIDRSQVLPGGMLIVTTDVNSHNEHGTGR